jgi:glycosyltransferase involved in cell wall biosynthesis
MSAMRFSILVPTWDNLPHLQLLVSGLRAHSAIDHQLLVHDNGSTDGTAQWLAAEGITHLRSDSNIGICRALNGLFPLAETDYICYFNDDMWPVPGWDVALTRQIGRIGHARFYLSATMIEPVGTGNACVVAPEPFGTGTADFDPSALLQAAPRLVRPHWSGSTWPPSVMHRSMWAMVGGYSEEFSPGLYSDPDLSMKLWQAGVREFMGVGDSLVYHFMRKSTGRVTMNDGRRQFLHKWGISASRFVREVLQSGQPYMGPLPDTALTPTLKERVKRWF